MLYRFGSFYREVHLPPTAILSILKNFLNRKLWKLNNSVYFGRYSQHNDAPPPPMITPYDYIADFAGSR